MIDSLVPIIVFFFMGNSCMDGDQCPNDTFNSLPNIYYYIGPNKGFECDPYKAGYIPKGMVFPFLREISLFYPKYRFAAAKYSRAASHFRSMIKGDVRYDRMLEAIDDIKKRKCIIGGFIVNYGFGEGGNFDDAQHLFYDFKNKTKEIRDLVEVKDLPFLFIRYQSKHQNEGGFSHYRDWSALVIEGLCSLEKSDKNISLIPWYPIPKEYFCTDHHENANGNKILADMAVCKIQENGFDFWYQGN